MRADPPLVRAGGLSKVYSGRAGNVQALDAVDLSVEPGELIVVRGRSGSGKTTLLNLLGGLDSPTDGIVSLNGTAIDQMDEQQLAAMRRSTIGFVFQSFGLLPILTAAENVELPMRMLRVSASERRDRARQLLAGVGLGERTQHRPHELSGGEQQRVSIARALANRPQLILADEPTGQLDSRTGGAIMELLAGIVRRDGIAAVIVTHDAAHETHADVVAELVDGRLTLARTNRPRLDGP